MSRQHHAQAALTPGKSRNVDEPRSRYVGYGKEKHLLLLPGFEHRTVQPAA